MEKVQVEEGTSPPQVLGSSHLPMVSCEEMEVSTLTLWGSSASSATKGVSRLLLSPPMR